MQLYLDDRNHARDVGTVGEAKNCKLEPVTNHAEWYSAFLDESLQIWKILKTDHIYTFIRQLEQRMKKVMLEPCDEISRENC